jgi:hypothetical protein
MPAIELADSVQGEPLLPIPEIETAAVKHLTSAVNHP